MVTSRHSGPEFHFVDLQAQMVQIVRLPPRKKVSNFSLPQRAKRNRIVIRKIVWPVAPAVTVVVGVVRVPVPSAARQDPAADEGNL